jgi:hypothetical protein
MFSFKKKPAAVSQKTPSINLQNPKILEVNLIKDEAQVSFDWNKGLFILVIMLILAGLLVTEVYFGLDWWEKQETARAEELRVETDKINQEAAVLKSQVGAALSYKEKSAAFSSLLNNHVYWNNFFSWLESNTLSTIRFDKFSGGLDGEYSLNGHAQTLADLSWQTNVLLKDPLTEKAEIQEAIVGPRDEDGSIGSVTFTLLLKVKPEIFLNKK